jgi:chromosome segregation ATPase
VKKGMREMGYELKAFADLNRKVDFLNERYRELLFNMKRLERDHRTAKRRADQTQKEKDTAKSELNKMTNKNAKLESLSKDLNKMVRDLRVCLIISATCLLTNN